MIILETNKLVICKKIKTMEKKKKEKEASERKVRLEKDKRDKELEEYVSHRSRHEKLEKEKATATKRSISSLRSSSKDDHSSALLGVLSNFEGS